MNYLAHAYLSFHQPEILVGNMISDHVKGKKKFDYSAGVQKGISLHRAIDEFTDNHPATHFAKQYYRPAYRLYAGAFIDVVYDYFLACDNNVFPTENVLEDFAREVYQVLEDHYSVLPERFQKMFPYMKKHDWLYNYRLKEGLEKSFGGLVYRAAYLHDSATAFDIFNTNYPALKKAYESFFPDLKIYSLDRLDNLMHG
ncbi:MAG: DUF479 domain-containing protein [Chitinophagaceae bacterium]|nr:DUF479 domain-containing protein [Chitinophagaceae bacterium]